MLTIRLQRTGKKNQADFRIVLAEKEMPVKKKHIEVLGSYNPRKKLFQVKEDRVKYWISTRVELSPTVHNLFVSKGLLDAKKVKAFNTPKKPAVTEAVKAPNATAAEASATPASEAPAEAPAEVLSEVSPAETPAEVKAE